MASFSTQVKEELCATITDRDREFACLYGILLCSRQLREDCIALQSESGQFTALVQQLLRRNFGDGFPVVTQQQTRGANSLYTITISDADAVGRVLSTYRIDAQRRGVEESNIVTNSLGAFLAGAFLSCGSVTDPNKDYHLEFAVPDESVHHALAQMLLSVGVTAKSVQRKGSHVLYVKSCEQIEDIFTFMGAQQATLDFINIEILKDVRNKANRIINCDLANINKVMRAAERQVKDILYLDEHVGLDTLSQDLREMALLRLENPELSLKELGELFDPPLGRSGVNHRLKRLTALAEAARAGAKSK